MTTPPKHQPPVGNGVRELLAVDIEIPDSAIDDALARPVDFGRSLDSLLELDDVTTEVKASQQRPRS